MADDAVAELDRRGRDLQAVLAGESQAWNDARREAMDGRYLRPHADAHDRVHWNLTSLFTSSAEARTAAGNVEQAAAIAKREGEQANECITGSGAGMAEAQAAVQAGLVAESAAGQGHDRTIQLAGEANSVAP